MTLSRPNQNTIIKVRVYLNYISVSLKNLLSNLRNSCNINQIAHPKETLILQHSTRFTKNPKIMLELSSKSRYTVDIKLMTNIEIIIKIERVKGGTRYMGKIIAVGNQKGGVGKSTTVYNIGVCMAQKGFSVLMVDMDVQSSLTQACGMDPMTFETNITALFEDKPGDKIANAVYDLGLGLEGNLHIICSTPMLASVELSLVQARSREFKLKKALQYIKDAYDYILIDCMPSLSLLTINSLSAANYLVVPAGCSRLDHFAFELFMQTTESIIEDLNSDLKILGSIATLYDCRATEDKEVLAELKDNYDLLGTIPRTTVAKKFVKQGLPVVLGKPSAVISKEYQAITDKILKLIEEV